MDVAQFRIPKGLMKEVDKLVSKGFYSSKSDVMRDALRKLIIESQVGSVNDKTNSVEQLKKARSELSKQIKSLEDIEEINNLN